MGVPFLPTVSMLGSDIGAELGLATITCPYTGQLLHAVPSLNPDVALVHVQRADVQGNAQIDGYTLMDQDLVLAFAAGGADDRGDRADRASCASIRPARRSRRSRSTRSSTSRWAPTPMSATGTTRPTSRSSAGTSAWSGPEGSTAPAPTSTARRLPRP